MNALLTALFILLPVALVLYGTVDLLWDVRELHRLRRRSARRRSLADAPGRATATVQSLRQTNLFVNQNPEVVLELWVGPATGGFPTRVQTVVPLTRLADVRPGCEVAVAYDPEHPEVVALALGNEA